jgi:hypothetical protein
VFLSYALVARDAGLAMPAFPPESDAPFTPELEAKRGEEGKSLVVSWSLPYTLHAPPSALLDIWLQVTKAYRQAYERHYRNVLYVPASEGLAMIRDLPPRSVCHLKARLILSDSNRSKFSQVSA